MESTEYDTEQPKLGLNEAVIELQLRAPAPSAAEAARHGHSRVGWADNREPLATGSRDSRWLMVTGRQVHCPHTPPALHAAPIPAAAAFAFMRVNRWDIRPEILSVAGGQKTRDLPRVAEYLRNYLRVACRRLQLAASDTTQEYAVDDGLTRWLFGRSSFEAARAERRAIDRRMEERRYAILCDIVSQTLECRYAEAKQRYRTSRSEPEPQRKTGKVNCGALEIAGEASSTLVDHRPTFPPAQTNAVRISRELSVLHLGIKNELMHSTGAVLRHC